MSVNASSLYKSQDICIQKPASNSSSLFHCYIDEKLFFLLWLFFFFPCPVDSKHNSFLLVPHLRRIRVIKHPEDDLREWVDTVRSVGRDGELGQGVLERLTQDAVEGQVRSQNALLVPLIPVELADLSPQTVQTLEEREESGVKQTRDKNKFVTGPEKLLPSSYFSLKPESDKIQHHAVTLPPNLDFNSWNWDTWPPCKVSLSGLYKYWVHQNTTNPAVGVCWSLGGG